MIKNDRFIFVCCVLPWILSGCASIQTPNDMDSAVSIYRLGQIIDGGDTGVTEAFIGGAAVLSPRHILLTIHQADPEIQTHYIHSLGEVETTSYIRHVDALDPKDGWEIRELSIPLQSHTPIFFARDPSKYAGQWCFIFKDTDPQHRHPKSMGAFIKSLNDPLKLTVYRGVLIGNQFVNHHLGKEYKSDKLFVRVEKNQGLQDQYDLQGSSGYPVVVFDHDLDRWVTVGVTNSGNVDKETGYIIATVVYPPYELIEQIQSQWPMVESTQPKAEQP